MSWAIVTGSPARGGAAISRKLHQAGLSVVLHHSPRSFESAQNLLEELLAARPNSALLWQADLAQPFEVPHWITALAPEYCVCNASVYRRSHIGERDRAVEDWTVHVLSHGQILHALQSSLTSIVGISDIHVGQPAPNFVWYTVAKAGLQALLLSLVADWKDRRVRCNLVAPGALALPDDWSDAQRAQAISDSIPLSRFGDFTELADAVKFLLLDATYVNGLVLTLDGGRSRVLA